jgi:hypothetical protein
MWSFIMKTRFAPALPFALFLLTLSISSLVAVDSGFAQQENLLGLFYDQSATMDEVEINGVGTHSLYLVLMSPVNNDFDGGSIQEVSMVGGFECYITPASGDVVLNTTYPLVALNVGDTANQVVGFSSGLPVNSSQMITLATFQVLSMGNNPDGYRLSPANYPSLPNSMAYVDSQDPDNNLVDMAPTSGSHDRPVFTFGDFTVDEQQSWDNVKSIYR